MARASSAQITHLRIQQSVISIENFIVVYIANDMWILRVADFRELAELLFYFAFLINMLQKFVQKQILANYHTKIYKIHFKIYI